MRSADKAKGFNGRRLLINALRSLHLIGMVGTGAAILGDRSIAAHPYFSLLLVASGIGIALVDWLGNPAYFRHVNGLLVLFKVFLLITVGWLAGLADALFWVLIVGSVLIAHAPAQLRHRRLF